MKDSQRKAMWAKKRIPTFKQFLSRVDQTSQFGLEKTLFNPVKEKYIDTSGTYHLYPKDRAGKDVIEHEKMMSGEQTVQQLAEFYKKHPNQVKRFMYE